MFSELKGRHIRRCWLGILSGSLAILLSCTDIVQAPEEAGPSEALVSPTSDQAMRPGERIFRSISASDPSFAGYFLENDSLIVLTSDLGRSDQLRSLVADHRDQIGRAAFIGSADRPISIRETAFSFQELSDWRALARPEVWASQEVVGLDLDEYRNTLSIHLARSGGEADLRRSLEALGIPAAAIHFEVTGVNRVGQTLDDDHRPLTGGYRIGIRDALAQPFGFCTFGFNAILAGDTVFVTNSHCTRWPYDPDGSAFYQNHYNNPSEFIGYEWVDPPGFSCSPWPWKPPCRHSDAAAVLHNSSPGDIAFGKIARTTYRNHTTPGSLIIDSSNPTFNIAAEDAWVVYGEIVNKIGQTSGWTYGVVGTTCSEETFERFDGEKHTVTCANNATYLSQAGDSGSPVFKWTSGSNVVLQGINFGSKENGSGWFSTMGSIEQDLGSLTVHDPPPPPPLSATLAGPNEVPEEGYCTWQGFGDGGAPPYSFAWSGVLSGTGSSISGTVGSSGWLYLTVTDASQGQANDQMFITVDEFAEECIE